MATLTIDVPDTLVVPLGKALARVMMVPEPTTNAERAALARAYMKQQAKAALLDYRAQLAGEVSRADDSDGAVSW
jgi:hypothetical protein